MAIILGDGEKDNQRGLSPEIYYDQLDYPIYLEDSTQIKFTVEQPEDDPVIRLDSNGMIHGLRPGRAKIDAELGGCRTVWWWMFVRTKMRLLGITE